MQSYAATLLTLFAVDLGAAMVPGPNFFLVSELALSSGRKTAAASVMGILTGNIIWAGAVAVGLGAIFSMVPLLYRALRLAGGFYLIYLGVTLWREKGKDFPHTPGTTTGRAYGRGLLTTISNPKCLLYFGSVFTLLLRPTTQLWIWLLAILIVAFNTVLWYGMVAGLFSHDRARHAYRKLQSRISALGSAILVGFGVNLILESDRR
jgi:threonine efflux protein